MVLTDEDLPLTPDYGNIVELPHNCNIQQLAVFYDDVKKYKVNRKLWNKLNSLNRVALFIHEMQWLNHRRYTTEETSEFVRNYVGSLFSVESAITTNFQYPSDALVCHAGINATENHDGSVSMNWNQKQSSMVIYPDPAKKNTLRIHMTKFFGRRLPSVVQFQIPKINIRLENLVHERGQYFSELRVVDIEGDFSQVLDPISVVPVLYKLRITYKYGENFKIDLMGLNNNILSTQPVSYCFKTK